MTSQTTAFPTLISAVWPNQQDNLKVFRPVMMAVLGTVLLAMCAQIQVPFYPVPITMQTFAVLTIGIAYGWRLGSATICLYLFEGLIGLPVFAGGAAGPAVFVGGTGGYLIGFVISAAACGWLAERGWDRHVILTAIAMLIGNVLMYVPGLLWLGAVFGWDKPILEWGLIPFIFGDLVKLALAASLLPLAWTFINKRAGKN